MWYNGGKQAHLLKAVSSKSWGWSKVLSVYGYVPQTVALGIFLSFLVGRISVSGPYLLPNIFESYFWPNRQRAGIRFPSFAYSFVSLILCQNYWYCHHYSSWQAKHGPKKKKSTNYKIGVANSLHFAYKRRVQCQTKNIIISGFHIAQIPMNRFQNWPINALFWPGTESVKYDMT